MSEVTFKELRKIEANQKTLIEKANQEVEAKHTFLNQREKELQIQAQVLEMQRVNDTRQRVHQYVDFAINSLPWWKRSLVNVMNLATKYKECIDAETQRLISIEIGKTMIEKEEKS